LEQQGKLEDIGRQGPGISSEIEILHKAGTCRKDVRRQGPGISSEIEITMRRSATPSRKIVARGLASRLRLKSCKTRAPALQDRSRQGPGISSEIEIKHAAMRPRGLDKSPGAWHLV